MGGHGSFVDPRLGIKIVQKPDLVQRKLPPLRDYQFSLDTPAPPAGSFDPIAAARGKVVFNHDGRCAKCHIPPLYTDINNGILHKPEETGMDPRRPGTMDEEERVVWEFGEELLRTKEVSDGTFAAMKEKFGEQGVIDLIGAMGYYTVVSMVLNVDRVPLPPEAVPLKKLDQ